MYTKSAFPTRLSFTSKPSFHLLVSIHSQQHATHSPCQIQGTSIHLYPSIFPYFPYLQYLPFLSFLPQHLVCVCVCVYIYIYIYISCFHSPASPSKKMLTLFLKFLLQHPWPTALIHFILPVTFFLTMSWFSTFKILCQNFSHHHCPSSSTATSITICAVLNSVRGCSVLFKFWWKWSTRFCNSNERGDRNICPQMTLHAA